MRNLACLLAVTLALGEQHQLRGQPADEQAAAFEQAAAKAEDSTLGQKSLDKVNGLINFLKRRSHPSEEHERRQQKDEKEALIDWKSFALLNSAEIVAGFAVWLVLYALFAYYYHSSILYYAPPVLSKEEKAERNHFRDFEDFKWGLFSYHREHTEGGSDHPGICFWACCCPGIRWADTMSKLSIHKFWPAFWFLTALYCISFIPLAALPAQFLIVCYMTYHRQEFRKKFNFEFQGGATWAADLFAYCCCMCCAVAQEARHTRQACLAGHPSIVVEGADGGETQVL